MGAALLSTPDLLCSILRALVKDIGEKHEIGISVKIRLLKTEEETRSFVSRLCATGITGLTIHCRTREMRKTERAVRDQLRMIGDICREAGVACLMNGDVTNREDAERLAREYNVDGAMIATAAEQNSSVFRPVSEGGVAPWQEVVEGYMNEAIAVENRWGNTKFLLSQLMPGKQQGKIGLGQAKNYEDVCQRLGLQQFLDQARELDARLDISQRQTKAEQKRKKCSRHVDQEPGLTNNASRKKQKSGSGPLAPAPEPYSEGPVDVHDIVTPTLKA